MLAALLLAAAPVSIAVPGVNCPGLPQGLCESFLDRLVDRLGANGDIKVMAQRDIAQVIGLERQRELLGCSDTGTSQCLAELAGALGVDALLSLSIAKSDPYYVATARVVRTRDAATLASASERVTREGELFDAMDKIGDRFSNALAPGGPVKVSTAPSRGGRTWVALAPAAVGVAAAVAGLAVFLSAGNERSALQRGVIAGAPDLVEAAVSTGRAKEQTGVGLMIGGGVALAAGLAWFFLSGTSSPVALVPSSTGASIAFSGAFP